MSVEMQHRTGGLLSGLRAFVKQKVDDAKKRSAHRAAEARKDRESVLVLSEPFLRMIREEIANIEDGLKQADLNAVSWDAPGPVRRLLGAEILRLARIRDRIAVEAGLPMESRNPVIRKEVNNLLLTASHMLEWAVMSDLKLPLYFEWNAGRLMAERVRRRTDGTGYIGVNSRYRYFSPPSLWA